jgi:hypothetical protein
MDETNGETDDLRRVVELRRKALRLRMAAEDAVETAKAAKEVARQAEAELAGFLDELGNPPPLFARPERLDVNAELAAGVREKEAEQARGGKRGGDDDEPERAEPTWPSFATDAWRLAPVGELGLAERTAEVLAEHDIRTVGEVVAMLGDDCLWISERESLDVSDCLDRFRRRLSDAQIADLDAARAGSPAPEAPAPKRGRKARVGA